MESTEYTKTLTTIAASVSDTNNLLLGSRISPDVNGRSINRGAETIDTSTEDLSIEQVQQRNTRMLFSSMIGIKPAVCPGT